MKQYYYIYRVGHPKLTVKYYDLSEAVGEAERLAGQHLGETFEILKCLAFACTMTP